MARGLFPRARCALMVPAGITDSGQTQPAIEDIRGECGDPAIMWEILNGDATEVEASAKLRIRLDGPALLPCVLRGSVPRLSPAPDLRFGEMRDLPSGGTCFVVTHPIGYCPREESVARARCCPRRGVDSGICTFTYQSSRSMRSVAGYIGSVSKGRYPFLRTIS